MPEAIIAAAAPEQDSQQRATNASARRNRTNRMRRISRNGNSTVISMPASVLEQLRWRAGDMVVIEIGDVDRLVIRAARATDLRAPGMPVPITSAPAKVSA